MDPIIGRHKEMERIQQILCKRRKNNPCLLGDPGVGKTVIAEGFAQSIVNATVPLKLQGKLVSLITFSTRSSLQINSKERKKKKEKLNIHV